MGSDDWIQEAARVAKQALCLNARCGAVVVRDDRIIGSGYNAPPGDSEDARECLSVRAFKTKPAYDRTCCVHAEWRAILDAVAKSPDLVRGSALYFARIAADNSILFSGEPYCTVCSRLALEVGIETFYLLHETGLTGYPTLTYNRQSYEALRS